MIDGERDGRRATEHQQSLPSDPRFPGPVTLFLPFFSLVPTATLQTRTELLGAVVSGKKRIGSGTHERHIARSAETASQLIAQVEQCRRTCVLFGRQTQTSERTEQRRKGTGSRRVIIIKSGVRVITAQMQRQLSASAQAETRHHSVEGGMRLDHVTRSLTQGAKGESIMNPQKKGDRHTATGDT